MREIFVFSDRQLGSVAEWQQAIEAEGFALRFSTAGTHDESSGHRAARFGNEDVGFECNQVGVVELTSRYSDVEFGRAWKFVRAFRSAPQLKPNVAAWISAAILAKVTGGKVFDPGADKLSVLENLLSSLREVDILELENESKKQKERTLNPLPSSPAVISVRLWKEHQAPPLQIGLTSHSSAT